MTTRTLLLSIAVALAASLVLAAGAYYLLKPGLTPELPRAEMPAVPEVAAVQAERDLHANTLEGIRAARALTEFAPRPVVRNPFLWPEDMRRILAAEAEREVRRREVERVAEPAEPEFELPRLALIMFDERRRLALLDRQVVREGDSVAGFMVAAIEESAVVARRDGREYRIEMAAPPRFLAVREPMAASPSGSAAPPVVPREDAPAAEKMRYLMQEMQQLQGVGID